MANSWFRWERQASLHLLFPTLEVFFTSLQNYSGVSSPTMVLIFDKGIVTWCIRESEFIEYGNKLLEVYSDSAKEKKMVSDIKKALSNLKKVEKEIKGLDLDILTNEQIVGFHLRLYQGFLRYYTLGAIGTPLSFAAEMTLKDKGLSDEQLNLLTTPDEISYVSKADKYLLKTKDIKGFVDKYFWIDNNYSGTKVINIDDVEERLNNFGNVIPSKEGIQSQGSGSPIKLGMTKEERRLIELLKNYSTYKDDRKKEILIYLHYRYYFKGSFQKS